MVQAPGSHSACGTVTSWLGAGSPRSCPEQRFSVLRNRREGRGGSQGRSKRRGRPGHAEEMLSRVMDLWMSQSSGCVLVGFRGQRSRTQAQTTLVTLDGVRMPGRAQGPVMAAGEDARAALAPQFPAGSTQQVARPTSP